MLALVLVLSAAGASGCAGTYRFDDGVGPDFPGIAVLRLQWRKQLAHRDVFDFRPQEWATPAFGPDGIYVGSSAGRFIAYDHDGRQRWQVRAGGAISSRPLYSPRTGLVYFGADDGRLYAVEARSGQVRWKHTTQGPILREPVEHEGLLLFSSAEDRIYALDAATGRWRWQYDRETPEGFTIHGYAGVAVGDNGLVFTGFSDGVLVALRASTGELVWTRSLAGSELRFIDVDATPTLVDGMLLATSYASGLYALSPDDGSVLWHFAVEGITGAAAAHGRLYIAAPRAGLIVLDRRGRELWRQAIPRGVPSVPVIVRSYVLVASSESGLFVADARTGELMQHFDPGHGISGPPAGNERMVALLSNVGHLYAFALPPR